MGGIMGSSPRFGNPQYPGLIFLNIRLYDFHMNERQMTVTEAARHFADLVNRTYYQGESTVLLRSGEAVAMLVPAGGSSQLGRDFATKWRRIRHLDADETESFAKGVEETRKNLQMPRSPWD